MTRRLPPQPTDTALARLVRRIVDAMPAWIRVRDLRQLNQTNRSLSISVRKLGQQLDQIARENYQLRRDYRKLFDACKQSAAPTPETVELGAEQQDCRLELHLRLSVEYRRLAYQVAIPGRDIRAYGISEVGAFALREAAEAIAQEHVPTHRDHLIRMALHGKTIAEVMK